MPLSETTKATPTLPLALAHRRGPQRDAAVSVNFTALSIRFSMAALTIPPPGRRVVEFFADGEILMVGKQSVRRILPAQPSSHEEIVRRRARSSEARHGDVARQSAAGPLQVGDDRADVGLGEELPDAHFAARQRIDLAEEMVVDIVRVAAEDGEFVGDFRQLRDRLAEMDAGELRGNVGERAADFDRAWGLGSKESICVTPPAIHR